MIYITEVNKIYRTGRELEYSHVNSDLALKIVCEALTPFLPSAHMRSRVKKSVYNYVCVCVTKKRLFCTLPVINHRKSRSLGIAMFHRPTCLHGLSDFFFMLLPAKKSGAGSYPQQSFVFFFCQET